MKRRLSLLLAVVMILGSFSFAFAADEVDPAKFLEENKILVGDKSGDLMLDKPLLRRDAVVILSRLMKAEDEAKNFEEEGLPTFKDITDKYYTPYLAWAQSNKYIKGHTEERFGFNDNLTTKEFATVLLRALGYIENAEDWDKVFDEAKKLELLEGVEKEADAELVRKEVAQMIYNALGVKMKDSDKTLAEFLGITMPEPDVLEVVEVKAENLKEITVVLSNAKLVKDDVALEDADNYRTNAGKIVDAKLVDNEVRLLLDGEMKQGKKYELSIQDIQKEINVKKEFVAYDNTAPKVEEVRVLGTQGIRVTMSEPIKNPHEKDFKLDGKNLVMRVRNYGRDITLIPYRENGKFEEGKHELTVGQLTDYAGFKSIEEKFDIEIVEDTTKPVVKRIVAKNNSVLVEFEQEVHPDSISKKNVSWTQVRGRKATEADGYEILSGNRVKYTFDKDNELPKPAAEITVKGVKNYSGYEMDSHTEVVSLTLDFSRPEIVDWKLLDDDKMEIVFNKVLDKNSAETLKNYTLNKYNGSKDKYEEVRYAISSVKLDKDHEDTVVVSFDPSKMEEGGKYRLDVSGVRDNTTLGNTMLSEEIFFTYGIGGKLEVVAVKKNEKEQIVLVFNKELVRREAEELRNYEFETNDGKLFRAEDLSRDPSIYLYGDGRTVEINLPGNAKTIKKVHLGIALTALDGNRMADRVVDLVESKVKITKAEITKDNEIKLTFNQKVEKVVDNFANEVTLTSSETAAVTKATVNSDGTITLTVTNASNVTKVKIAAKTLKTEYEEYKNKEIEKATTDVRKGSVLDVKVTKTAADKAKVEVEFNKELNNATLEGLGIRVGGVTYSKWASTDYKTFVFSGVTVTPSATRVEVEVLTNGVEDIDGNEVKGKTGEYIIAGTADADLNDVNAALSWLTEDIIKGENEDLSNVKKDLNLPTVAPNGISITWISNDASVIATTGTVTRPNHSDGNETVTLTATVSKGSVTISKNFTVTVLAEDPTSAIISPDTATFDISNPADVTTTITFNDATTIEKISAGTNDLGIPSDYEVSTDASGTTTLTIKSSYLSSKLTTAGEELTLTITFDVGDPVTLTITAQ